MPSEANSLVISLKQAWNKEKIAINASPELSLEPPWRDFDLLHKNDKFWDKTSKMLISWLNNVKSVVKEKVKENF